MQKIRLSKSCLSSAESDAVLAVLDSEYLGMGEETRLLEEEIKLFIGGDRNVLCVNTGTSALHIALASLGLRAGDEVLVPSLTYVASFQAVLATGARPIACDVNLEDGLIDLADAARRTTSRTRAVMPVHYASNASNIPDVYDFAAKHKLRVVEDAAHSFGGSRDRVPIGQDGDILCFSFDGIKNITCGEGGAVVTGDNDVARKIADGRLLGVERDTEARYRKERSWDFDVKRQGFRYHMSNINAAIGRAQLRKLPTFAERRKQLAVSYARKLENQPRIVQLRIDYSEVVPHIMPVRIQDGYREQVRRAFEANNIEWGFHYKPNHLLSLFGPTSAGYPATNQLAEELFTLPLHPDLTDEMQDRVVAVLLKTLHS